MSDENVPVAEDLHGQTMGEILNGGIRGTGGNRTITITLSEDEYERIGGSEGSLNRLSQDVADFVNKKISKSK